MPSSRATARSDSAAAPAEASCRRAASVISRVSSARTLARAPAALIRESDTPAEHLHQQRAVLGTDLRTDEPARGYRDPL